MLVVFMAEGDAEQLFLRAVRQVWGMQTLPELIRQPNGKPMFANEPGRYYNLSHSGSLALCALSDHPVGVDIEVIRPRKDNLPRYAFDGARYERFLQLGGDWPSFYVIWTEIESIVKYTGEGLRAWRRADQPKECTITSLSGQGWKGSVCGQERAQFYSFSERKT